MKRRITLRVTNLDRQAAATYCRFWRERDNLTQAELAQQLNTQATKISLIENREQRAPTWLVRKLSDLQTLVFLGTNNDPTDQVGDIL